MKYITVDGMLSDTGIRDTLDGGDIPLEELGISSQLGRKIARWVRRYKIASFAGYRDSFEVGELDTEGVEIRKLVQKELIEAKVEYYSDAQSKRM